MIPFNMQLFELLVIHLFIFLENHALPTATNHHLVHALRMAVDNLFHYWKGHLQ